MPLYSGHSETILASSLFWEQAAKRFLIVNQKYSLIEVQEDHNNQHVRDFSSLRVVVPTFEHVHLFLKALSLEIQGEFIPPRIQTMFAWMGMQAPIEQVSNSSSERLMTLYGQLREHAWLKSLFGAKRNTDLLPLAQTLLTLSDELTQVWLPQAQLDGETVHSTWLDALQQLPFSVQKLCSDETQLVWTIWKGQLDAGDRIAQEFNRMMQVAHHAQEPLIWITPTLPNPLESAFLQAYQQQQKVVCITLDWNKEVLDSHICLAWPHLLDLTISSTSQNSEQTLELSTKGVMDFSQLKLYAAQTLEDEAEQAAQTIIHWLQDGKTRIAVIAQDRVVSRRLRALLERANVIVTDETGWKLSTTRAAAALAAWFELLSSRADTMALLDFLKSPFVAKENKEDFVMEIELALRRSNVIGGWDAVLAGLEDVVEARAWVASIARISHAYIGSGGRKTVKEWTTATMQVMTELGLQETLQEDVAGNQILQMIQGVHLDCQHMSDRFSFSEWRALINLQLEATPFTIAPVDKRVVMLPLNGARLRHFDAVYLIGGDASHLPSRAQETLFFTNAVRRECGLVTREERQQQQLRDFAELILSNSDIVLSWQTQTNGEHNAVSPWIEQIDLMLECQNLPPLKHVPSLLKPFQFPVHYVKQAMPSAPQLLPNTLSASGLTSLMACPYQFFAGRMLKLNAIDELSDMPEKRDYGDWLHAILKTYHDKIKADNISNEIDREKTLREISNTLFLRVLKKSPAALGYSIRWNKVIPAYLLWAKEREDAGWQFAMGESWEEQLLHWDIDGVQGEVMLRGRIDRVDSKTNADNAMEYAVLDYKAKNLSSLKKRLKNADDHQLAFYGLLSKPRAQEANYVSLELEKEKIGDVEANGFEEWQLELESAIRVNMQAIQVGSPLTAQGIESVCQYCDVRGLCRKGAWL
jgi:ATP-dependent helicase/nuclease subunit B